jgi:hypothetical protein
MSAGVLFPCIHGGICDERTITFDSSDTANYYTLHWKQALDLPWQPSVEICPATCTDCRQSCQVYIHHPENPQEIVFFSLTATNEAGESEH